MTDGFSRVAAVSEVPAGELRAFKAPDGVEVAIANVAGEFYAFMNMCSHEDASLHFGWLNSETCEVECPLHEGRFDVRTGAATGDPAVFPVKTYYVRVDGDDILVGPSIA